MRTNFRIVIPSYNNENWVEYNLASILNQTYSNYSVLYIDDASKDHTLEKAKEIIGDRPNWKLVTNETNKRRGYNVSPFNIHIQELMQGDDDVLVFVDGDDWLYDENVLANLNQYYISNDVWMTYGGMACYPSGLIAFPQNTNHDDIVHEENLFRRDVWRASHLRTFKWGLYKRVKMESMVYSKTGDYYFHAEDLATSYPCLEMCPKNKVGNVPFLTYVFNETPSNRERGIARENEAGHYLEAEIRTQKPYNKIKSIYG
jgi:glycosyltransferase involved in cell wall biosynthesis